MPGRRDRPQGGVAQGPAARACWRTEGHNAISSIIEPRLVAPVHSSDQKVLWMQVVVVQAWRRGYGGQPLAPRSEGPAQGDHALIRQSVALVASPLDVLANNLERFIEPARHDRGAHVGDAEHQGACDGRSEFTLALPILGQDRHYRLDQVDLRKALSELQSAVREHDPALGDIGRDGREHVSGDVPLEDLVEPASNAVPGPAALSY